MVSLQYSGNAVFRQSWAITAEQSHHVALYAGSNSYHQVDIATGGFTLHGIAACQVMLCTCGLEPAHFDAQVDLRDASRPDKF